MEKRKTMIVNPEDLYPPKDHEIDKELVAAIAESIPKCGLRQPIVVVGRHIKHGVHRWAAVCELGLKHVEVLVDEKVDTDEEHDAQVIVENLCRRHYEGPELDAMRKRLVDLWEPKIAQEMQESQKSPNGAEIQSDSDSGQKRRPGRKKTPKGEAIRQVAKQTGATEKAVQRSVEKTKAAEAGVTPKQPDDPPAEPEATIDDYDTEIPESEVGRWREARQLLDELNNILRGVQIKLGNLVKIKGLPHSVATDLDKRAQQFAELARNYYPVSLCEWCNGTGKNHDNNNGCPHCVGVGFVAEVNYDPQKKPSPAEKESSFTEDDLDW
jgi:ParB-like chromosome segregation protein Spo0J